MLNERWMRLLSNSRRYIAGTVISRWLSLLVLVAAVFAGADLIGEAYDQTMSDGSLRRTVLLFLLFLLIRFVCGRVRAALAGHVGLSAAGRLQESIFVKFYRLGITYRDTADPDIVIRLAAESSGHVEQFLSRFLPQLLYSVVAPVILFFAFMRVNLPAAAVFLVCSLLFLLVLALIGIIASRRQRRGKTVLPSFEDRFRECMSGMTALKMYQADAWFSDKMEEEYKAAGKQAGRVQLPEILSAALLDILTGACMAAGMIVVMTQFLHGSASLADSLKVLLLAPAYFVPLRKLGQWIPETMRGLSDVKRLFRFLDGDEPERGGIAIHTFDPDIRLDNVRYSHDGLREDLRGVDLHLEGNGLYSLTGESGSGKSTAAALIAGRLRGADGMIRLSGLNIETIRETDIMKNVLYIHRNSYLFDGTVADNLLIANPYISWLEMEEILKQVGLKTVLDSREGVNTRLSNNASELTDGQRQRLILARAILYNPAVLIMDEMTLGIDAESEAVIMKNARELSRDKIVLLISARLKNILTSDTIYLMENGRIAESGSHRELMAAGGKYAALYRRQTAVEQFARSVDEEIPESFLDNRDLAEHSGTGSEEAVSEEMEIRSIRRTIAGLFRLTAPVSVAALLSAAAGAAGWLLLVFLSLQAARGLILGIINPDTADPSGVIMSMGLFILLAGFLRAVEKFGSRMTAYRLGALLRRRTVDALRSLWPAFTEESGVQIPGRSARVLPEDIEDLENYYAHLVYPGILFILSAAGIILTVGHFCMPAVIPLLLAYIVSGAVLLMPSMTGAEREKESSGREWKAFVQDSMRGLDETIQFGYGGKRRQALLDLGKANRSIYRSIYKARGWRKITGDLIRFAACAAVIIMMIMMYRAGQTNISSVMYCTLAYVNAFLLTEEAFRVTAWKPSLMDSARRVLHLMELGKTVSGDAESLRNTDVPQEEPYPDEPYMGPAVLMEHVFFYNDQEPGLYDISAVFGRNEITGIYGTAGSGKSMILKIIMGMREPKSGSVYIAGRDMRTIPSAELYAGQAFIPAQTWLFRGTVSENIALGKNNVKDEDIIRAAEKAFAHEDILALKDGYGTRIGGAGEGIPAGLRQRIGLARAVLSGAELLLLDDPTDDLDAYNEGLFLRALMEQSAERSVIIASGRRSVVDVADRIIHIENAAR